MKNFLFGLAIGIAVTAPASASSYFAVAPNGAAPAVVAGEVNSYGVPIGGSGFTSKRLSQGNYEIEFENGRIRGCVAMVASPESLYDTATTNQVNCSRKFYVIVGDGAPKDSNFHFIAVVE